VAEIGHGTEALLDGMIGKEGLAKVVSGTCVVGWIPGRDAPEPSRRACVSGTDFATRLSSFCGRDRETHRSGDLVTAGVFVIVSINARDPAALSTVTKLSFSFGDEPRQRRARRNRAVRGVSGRREIRDRSPIFGRSRAAEKKR